MPFDGTFHYDEYRELIKMQRVIDMLSDEKNWIKGQATVRVAGREKHCMVGALVAVGQQTDPIRIPIRFMASAISKFQFGRGIDVDSPTRTYMHIITEFNDAPETTHQMVLTVLQFALADMQHEYSTQNAPLGGTYDRAITLVAEVIKVRQMRCGNIAGHVITEFNDSSETTHDMVMDIEIRPQASRSSNLFEGHS